MATESQAQKWILDCDGSFRDVTFTPTSKDAIVAFVKYLLPRYVVSSALIGATPILPTRTTQLIGKV